MTEFPVEIKQRTTAALMKSLESYIEFAEARKCASDEYFYRELYAELRCTQAELAAANARIAELEALNERITGVEMSNRELIPSLRKSWDDIERLSSELAASEEMNDGLRQLLEVNSFDYAEAQAEIARLKSTPMYLLARRCLWIAYVWNDHNFDAAHLAARKEAKAHGITDFDSANKWLELNPPTQEKGND